MTRRSTHIHAGARAAGASALLLAALLGCDARGTVDELSLVQMSAQATAAEEAEEVDEAENEVEQIIRRRGHNATSLLAIPGVKGMKEQLQEAAGFKMPAPEQGYHKKVVKALPKLQSECKTKPFATEEDCNTAVDLLTMMSKSTEGPEPMWTWHGHLRSMIGLHFWLYTPGTMLCFTILDMDQSKGISYEEMTRLFGPQLMAGMNPVWKFLDPDGNGSISREELYKYLRAAIMARDVLPELDGIDPKADTRKCLNMAHRVLAPPVAPMKKMKFYPKLLSIAGIALGAMALHCLLCSTSPKKAVDKVDEKVEKDPDRK